MSVRKPVIRVEFDEVGIAISREGMQYEPFGEHDIFRPRSLTERTILAQEAEHFLSKFSPGQYKTAAEINAAIRHLCEFYGSMLETNLTKLGSRDYVEFLLSQYDESFKVEMSARQGRLSQEKLKQWEELGRVFRRAIKYLLERICSLEPLQQPGQRQNMLWTTEVVQICAEEFVHLCILSDSTYSIFPSETLLTVFAPGSPKLYFLEVLNERGLQMGERIEIDGLNRSRVIEGRSIDRNVESQNEHLGAVFLQAHGIEYKDAINVLGHLVNSVEPSDGPFEIQFFHKNNLLESFASNLGLSRPVLEKSSRAF